MCVSMYGIRVNHYLPSVSGEKNNLITHCPYIVIVSFFPCFAVFSEIPFLCVGIREG